jgi:hypothetical protein
LLLRKLPFVESVTSARDTDKTISKAILKVEPGRSCQASDRQCPATILQAASPTAITAGDADDDDVC